METNYLVTTKKIIGIYYYWYLSDEDYLTKGGGGTGRWFFELSRELMNMGYHVILFGKINNGGGPNFGRHYGPYNIDIMSLEGFEYIREKQHFDHFISIGSMHVFEKPINCNSLYIMCHNNYTELEDQNDVYYDPYKFNKLLRYAVLSEDSKKRIKPQIGYDTTDRDFFLTSNGVDQSFYSDVDTYQKKNKMVWSSRPERGLKTFIKYVYPLIKKEVPDFEVDVCSYINPEDLDMSEYLEDNSIHFLGRLNQEDLAKIQKESKIWVYPNLGLTEELFFFHETFCITAVENALSKNVIICLGNKDGIQTVFNGYDSFLSGNLFNEYETIYPSNYKLVGEKMAEMAIKALKDENYRKYLVDQTYNLSKKYTWRNAALGWVKEWGEEEFVNTFLK